MNHSPPNGQLYTAQTAHVEPEGHRCLWQGCDKIASDPETLYTHLCNDHIGRKAMGTLCLTCKWKGCDTVCAKRDHITSHLRVHTPLKPHGCPICSKTFKRPQDLKKHEKIHTQEHAAAHKPSRAASENKASSGTEAPKKAKVARPRAGSDSKSKSRKASSSSGQENGSPDLAHPSSVSLSPLSNLSSDPLTPPFHALPASFSDFSDQPPFQASLAQFPYGQNLYDQSQVYHAHQPVHDGGYGQNYGSMQNGGSEDGSNGRVQAGQKRGSDYDGLFDEVKKRKIEPTYDTGMKFRLDEMVRNFAQPAPNSFDHNQPPPQFGYQNQNQNAPPFFQNPTPQLNAQPSYANLYNQNMPDIRTKEELAAFNTFFFRVMMQAQAEERGQTSQHPMQQQNGLAGQFGMNGQQQGAGFQQLGGMGVGNGFQHQQQNVQQQQINYQQPPIQFDANILAQLGLSGAPGLDPNVLYNQIATQNRQPDPMHQFSQQQPIQQGFHGHLSTNVGRQQQHQQSSNLDANPYHSLNFAQQQSMSSSLPLQNQQHPLHQNQNNVGRSSSFGNGINVNVNASHSQSLYPSLSMPYTSSLPSNDRPIAQLPSHRSSSNHISIPAHLHEVDQLGMQTLLGKSDAGRIGTARDTNTPPSNSSHGSSPASHLSSPPSGSDYESSLTSIQSVEQLFLGSDLANFPALHDLASTSKGSSSYDGSSHSPSDSFDFSSMQSSSDLSLLPYPSLNLLPNLGINQNLYASHSPNNLPYLSSPTLQNSFDSLAPSRGASVTAGLASGEDLLAGYGAGRTYRMMEPLGSAPVSRERTESNERGSADDQEKEEESPEEDEQRSPSDVAMKGALQIPRAGSDPEQIDDAMSHLSVSPGLPSTLQRALLSGEEILKLPSIHPHRSSSLDPHARSLSPPSSSGSPPSSLGSPETVRDKDSRPATPTRQYSNVSLPSFTSLSLYPTLAPLAASNAPPRLDTSSSSRPSTASSSATTSPSTARPSATDNQPVTDPAKHIELIKMLLVQVNASWRRSQAEEMQMQENERRAASRAGSVEVKVEMEA